MSAAGNDGRPGRENRLAREISPYLLLHRHNPVDWYPWGEEALGRARREDKPIFLSVGYATCYWCHVMERESFSDAGTARLMNEYFVNVKVDREERPELDEIYMAATQIYTYQGGWPNSVFLTPKLAPFFCGTYFPPADRYGRPSFRTVLISMKKAWDERRDEVEEQAAELSEAMRRYLQERGKPQAQVAPASVAQESFGTLAGRFDAANGGFGGAPKFPSPSNLFLLLELAGENEQAGRLLSATLDAMARGGIYDQLAGGFHRYATDAAWKIPHFEKMLYDNGLLLELYALDFARTAEPERARIVRETATFLEREMTAPGGGFYSAIDAEVGGREGAYHVWTRPELEAALGPEDATLLAPIFGFAGAPFFDHDYYVLHLPEGYDAQAARRRVDREALLAEVAPLKARLVEVRESRPKPLVDDKILTDWNGMAIRGLAVAGLCLGDPTYVEMARRAADFLLAESRLADGTLAHSWRAGEARIAGFLGDYVFLVGGLLALHEATGDPRWLAEAERLTDEQIARLGDSQDGGFFVAGPSDDVLFRSKEVVDGALPATNAMAALHLLALAERSAESARWRALAEQTLKSFSHFAERQPEGARMLALAIRRWHGQAPPGAAPAASPARSEAPAALGQPGVRFELGAPKTDGYRVFRLDLAIPEGWHLYAHDPGADFLAGLRLEARHGQLRVVAYPPGELLDEGGVQARVHHGQLQIVGEVLGEEAELILHYQACDHHRCLPPAELALAL